MWTIVACGLIVGQLLWQTNGNFTDVTNFIPANATQDAYQGRLTWVEPWQMIDINNAYGYMVKCSLNYAPNHTISP